MSLKLYFDPISQPSRAVYLLLKLNNIPFEEIIVDLGKAEQKTAWFTEINPYRLVPVIDHDGFILTESVAILRYICRTFPVEAHWYPEGNSHRIARIDEFMAWQNFNIRPFGCLTFLKTVEPKNFMVEFRDAFGGGNCGTQAEQFLKFKSLLLSAIETTNATWLKDNKYVAGPEITIADLIALEELEQPRNAGIDVGLLNEKIGSYMSRVRSKLEPHYSVIHAKALEMVTDIKNDPEKSDFTKIHAET